VQNIQKNFEHTPVKEQILNFISNSKTGIIRRPSKTASDADFTF
jgi:hypothetical protein